jgi:NAD(P)-dependent dehydrogenase (short-subunit alcohol dehydrogenase family)
MTAPRQPKPAAAPVYKRLKDRRILVTGAGSGIGKATALRMAAEGAHVACVDIKGAKATASEIKKSGGQTIGYDMDVTNATEVEATVNKAAKFLGGLDVLCNIAGIGHFALRRAGRSPVPDRRQPQQLL